MRRALLLFAATLVACSPGEPRLFVDLRTDLIPGVEFASVRTLVETRGDDAHEVGDVRHRAVRSDDAAYESGVRIAGLAAPPGNLQLRVDLLDDAGAVIVGRTVITTVHGTHAVTVVITRTCVGAVCPAPGDAADATECAGRRCVPPECTAGGEGCATECATDADCPAPIDCARALCVEGSCFAASDEASCDPGSFCHPTRGCVVDAPEVDAGMPVDAGPVEDSGLLDAGADPCAGLDCDDENPCTDDACATGACTHADNTALCDDGVFCNGADSCTAGACAVHAGEPCSGATVCDESADTCTGCIVDGDCPGDTLGSWSACGYSDTCDEASTRSRDATRWTCESGACVSDTTSESEPCTRDTDTIGCGTTAYGAWGACGGYSNTCDESGTQSRSVTTYACAAGACTPSTGSESRACTRDTDAVPCGTTAYGAWSACGGYASTCDESGTQSRSVTTYACAAGTCSATTGSESGACTRDTDTVPCGTTEYGAWGACGGYGSTCDESGTQSRSVTTYACAAGTCSSSVGSGSQACARDTDGMACTGVGGFPCNVYGCRTGFCAVVGDTCGTGHCCEFGCRPMGMLCD